MKLGNRVIGLAFMVLLVSGSLLNSGSGNGATLSYSYDENGRLSGMTDEEGDGVSYEYDANGNLLARVIVDEVVFRTSFETD